MNQVEVNQLATIDRRKRHAGAVFDKRVSNLNAARREILDRCDHKHPNGKSAMVDMIQCMGCGICGWMDLY